MTTRSVREPAVAGTFYPAPAARLSREVEGYLAEARARPEAKADDDETRGAGTPPGAARSTSSAPPKALIVPHAGYVYSGPVAASAYALLGSLRERVRRVVLLGPCHRVYLRGIAASGADAFRTPLGEVPLDREAIERALTLPCVECFEQAHAEEHSLEVQLPFLQQTLDAFRLAPFAVGEASTSEVSSLLEALWGGAETLIVISSDLSHYYDYDTACRLDSQTSRSIETLDAEALGEQAACGRIPVRGLLAAARRRGLQARTLDLRNSGDTAGPRDRVVGYGAYAIH